MKLNLDYLLEKTWEYLALVNVYTKRRGGKIKQAKTLTLLAVLTPLLNVVLGLRDRASFPGMLFHCDFSRS